MPKHKMENGNGESASIIQTEKKRRQKVNKFPGCTMIPIKTDVYNKFAETHLKELAKYGLFSEKQTCDAVLRAVAADIEIVLTPLASV